MGFIPGSVSSMTASVMSKDNLTDEVVRSLDMPLFVLDEKRAVYFMNHAAEEMTGTTGAQARGAFFCDLMGLDNAISDICCPEPVGDKDVQWKEAVCHLGDGTRQVMMRRRVLDLPNGSPGMVLTVQEAANWEQRYERILSSSPLIFIEADTTGRMIYSSRQLADNLCMTQGELEGCSIFNLIAEEHRPTFENMWRQALSGEAVRIRDICLGHRDGDNRHFWVYLFPFVDPHHAVTGICALAGDLAEQKGLAYALEAAEERFSVLFHQSSDPIMILSMQAEILSVNPAFERITGVTSDELFSGAKQWKDIIYEQDRLRVLQGIQRCSDDHLNFVMEFRMKTPGGLVWFEQSHNILHDEKGSPRGIMAVARDITRMKEREHRLREETKVIKLRHQRAQELIARLTHFMTMINELPGEIYGYLQGLCDLLYDMYSPLIVYIHILDVNYVCSCHEAGTLPDGVLDGKGGVDASLLKASFSGGEETFYCNLFNTPPYANDPVVQRLGLQTCINVPMRDSSGAIRGWLTMLDTKEREYDHLDIEVMTVAALQAAARLKTHELDGAQQDLQEHLRQSKKMEAVGMLAGGIAHDFNNILSGILGFSSYLLSKVDAQSEIHRQIGLIEQSAMRAADLTRQLLAFSRRTNFSKEPVPMNQVIEETLGILEHSIPKSITINKRLDPNVPAVLGDRGQLNQVIMNLCLNASEAMGDKAGTLNIQTECRPLTERERSVMLNTTENDYVCIDVGDTGRGIHPDVMEHIFDPFYTTKGKSGGSGLGLSIVYGIVSNHGGDISVESARNEGTTFHVYLPACADAEPRKNGKVARKPIGGSETVLIVDDEAIVRQMVSDIIKDHGYTAICAGCGEDAVEELRQRNGTIDLILLDMVMPGMDGVETFCALKELNPDSRILLTTGFAEGDRCAGLIKQGALGLVRKPYKSQDLLFHIRKVLDAV
ncbi:MAG: PAS domain S-box protein [Spartobacteria bacterium]|nr:PAS domain S-box protein [Spartobacteria bacterium]